MTNGLNPHDQTLPAADQLEAVATVTDDAVQTIEEVVADKGYHSRTVVHDLETLGIRTYISEPDRGPQSWTDQAGERDAVYANRRRIRGERGKRLLRRRGELLERPCAHLYETGGLRRTHVRGHENVLKRLLVHASAFNLGFGCGGSSASARHAPSRGASRRYARYSACSGSWIYEVVGPIWKQRDCPVRVRPSGVTVDAGASNGTCTTAS
jgi:hypothetical protein